MTTTATDLELSDAQIKAFAIQGQLGINTAQRNGALADLNSAKYRLQQTTNDKHSQYFVLMGRLVKYEPDQVFSEVLEYAFENGLFYKTDSKLLGIFSKIGDYTTANGKKTYKAHFTTYGHFLKKCEKDDEEPISYTGNFLMKNFKEYFVIDKTETEYSKLEHFIKVIKPEVKYEYKCSWCDSGFNHYENMVIDFTDGVNSFWCKKCPPGYEKKEPDKPEKEKAPFPRNNCDKCNIQVIGNNSENGGGCNKAENWIYCEKCYETEIWAKMPGNAELKAENEAKKAEKPKRKYVRKPK
jgi:hypothetical protein